MIAEIRDANRAFFPCYYTEKEMTPAERLKLRKEISRRIGTWFKWSDYDEKFRHLVYYVELDGVAHFYVNGYLMTEDEFEEDVAAREGIGYVGALHRPTPPPCFK